MDNYAEQIVKRENTSSESTKKIGIIAAVIIICIILGLVFIFTIGTFISLIALILAAGAVYGSYILLEGLNVEYEYIMTNGELDVDKIIAKKKRKSLISIDLTKLEGFGKYSENIKVMIRCKFVYAVLSGALLLQSTDALSQTQRTMTVSELFSLVETGSRQLRAQKSEVDVAHHAISEAKSRRLPDVNASLSVSYNGNVLMTDRDFSNAKGITQPHFGNSFALEAQQMVYAGGAINTGIRLAELQKEQAETGVALSRSQQRFMALGQYLDLVKLSNGMKVYDSNIALTEKLIADIKAKHEEGIALRNDVTRYELQMESLKLGLRKLQDQRSVLNHQLCNTLGLTSDVVIMPDTAELKTASDNGNEADWQSRASVSSPLLRQSKLGVDMAQQQLRMAKSDLMPKVVVFATDNFSGPFTYDLPPIDNNFNIWYVGIGIKYSLSSLFKGNKTVRKAKAQIVQSNENHAVTAESVDNQMQQAYTLYRQSFVELRTQQKSVELAAQNYQVVSDRYMSQMALITDMVDASNIKLNAELQEVDARIGTIYAYYKMKYIAGEI